MLISAGKKHPEVPSHAAVCQPPFPLRAVGRFAINGCSCRQSRWYPSALTDTGRPRASVSGTLPCNVFPSGVRAVLCVGECSRSLCRRCVRDARCSRAENSPRRGRGWRSSVGIKSGVVNTSDPNAGLVTLFGLQVFGRSRSLKNILFFRLPNSFRRLTVEFGVWLNTNLLTGLGYAAMVWSKILA